MAQNLWLSAQITLLGMGLVFGAILLLWGLIVVLVRFSAESEPHTKPTPSPDLQLQKQQAAALAVAIALAQTPTEKPNVMPLPPTALVSAWQAVMRSSTLDKRGSTR